MIALDILKKQLQRNKPIYKFTDLVKINFIIKIAKQREIERERKSHSWKYDLFNKYIYFKTAGRTSHEYLVYYQFFIFFLKINTY